MATTHVRTCPLCEATCGLALTVEDERVTRVTGDREDVFSQGFICPKGAMIAELDTDPDRLRAPLVRDGDTFREATWDEAWARVEKGLRRVISAHGRDAVAIYAGNPNAHGHEAPLMATTLVKAFRSRNFFSASTVDQMPKHVSAGLMFGRPDMIPVPDLDRTSYLLMLGANPYVSNGSLATAPDWPGRLQAIRKRGGKIVVVDPRLTKTAKESDEHIAITPGTDVYFLLAIAQTLFAEGRVSLGHLDGHVNGLEEVAAICAPYTPEAVEPVTGVPATTTTRIARELSDAASGCVYDRIGTHTVEFGTLTSWAADVVNVLTGNLDREGGRMFVNAPHARVDPPVPGGRGFQVGRWRSRVRDLPEVRGELPVATMADEMETPGEGQVRAFICLGGNPTVSTPNAARLRAAIEKLDFRVSVDPQLNETSRLADVILPPPSPLRRAHYDWAFYGLSIREVANYSPPLFEAQGPAEWEILARLALIASAADGDAPAPSDPAIVATLVLDDMIDRECRSPGSPIQGRDPAEIRTALEHRSPMERILDLRLRSGPFGDAFGARPGGLSLEVLERNPHGVDLGPLTPQLPERIRTTSGRVELAPPEIAADTERLARAFEERRRAPRDGLVLIGRRHLRSNNSWMHNVRQLVGGTNRCTLQIHPEDAARVGLEDGAAACVRSRIGEIEVEVEITDTIARGVVSLPHGWGHEGTGMRVASANAGVNSNVLTDELAIDAVSGNAVLNAIPVEVSLVRVPEPA